MKFSCLPTLLFLSSLGAPTIFAQQPQPATTAQEARRIRDAEHAKSSPADPATDPATTAPAATPAPAAPAKPAAPLNFNNVPVPPPKTVKPKMKVKAKDGDSPPTIIDARNLEYSQDKSMATFTGKVRLRSVNTDIDCEELVIYFKKKQPGAPATPPPTDKKTAPAAPGFDPNKANKPDPLAPPGSAAPEAAPEEEKDGSQQIEKAVAKGLGTIVTIVKRSPKDTSICKCGEATYVQETGVMIMKIFPEVYQGGKGLRANDRDTVMTLDKDNRLTATGDLKTILLNEDKKKPAKDGAAPDASTTPAAGDKPATPGASAPKPPSANPKPAKPATR